MVGRDYYRQEDWQTEPHAANKLADIVAGFSGFVSTLAIVAWLFFGVTQ